MNLSPMLSDIKLDNLDFSAMGGWPRAAKLMMAGMLALVVSAFGYLILVSGQINALQSARQQERELVIRWQARQLEASHLEWHRLQLQATTLQLAELLKQLPAAHDIPDLLDDISKTAMVNGLRDVRIQLQTAFSRDDYREVPITITALGNYHQFGHFVTGITRLPYIVNLQDFSIKAEPDLSLHFKMTASTYRYPDAL